MKDGIYNNISEAEYHALPYLGSSTLKRFKFNPYASQQPFEASDALLKTMALGTATHKLVLEGREAYEAAYVVSPGFDKRTKEGKAGYEAFIASAAGKTVIDQDQAEAVEGMAKSLREHPAAGMMLNRGANEVTVIWTDEETGLTLKARPDDYFNTVATDLKTTKDVSKFKWAIRDLAYPVQAAHYTDGLLACGAAVDNFIFIAVQSTGTYPVVVGSLTQEHQAEAKTDWRRLLNLYAECQRTGYWPNFEIPKHVQNLEHLTAYDLFEEW